WNGFIVPGSTLRYGSSLRNVTRSPRASSSAPSDAEESPLPSDDSTPPVTKMNLVGRLVIAPPSPASSHERLGSRPGVAHANRMNRHERLRERVDGEKAAFECLVGRAERALRTGDSFKTQVDRVNAATVAVVDHLHPRIRVDAHEPSHFDLVPGL